jgi:Fe2+ or Zn2+ uptake regulation protein
MSAEAETGRHKFFICNACGRLVEFDSGVHRPSAWSRLVDLGWTCRKLEEGWRFFCGDCDLRRRA